MKAMMKKILSVSSSTLLTKIIGIIFSGYIAASFGASTLGIFTLFISVLGFSTFFAKLGLFYSLEKKVSEGNGNERELLTATFILNLILLLITISLLIFIQELIAKFITIDIINVLLILLILQNYNMLLFSVLKARKKFYLFSFLNAVRESVPKLLTMLLVTIFSKKFEVIFNSLIIIELLILICALILLKDIRLVLPKKESFFELIYFAKYNSVLELRNLAFSWIDIWCLGLFLSETYVGIYQLIWQISSGILMFNKSMITVFFPYINFWFANNRIQELKSFLRLNYYLIYLIPIPVFVFSPVAGGTVLGIFGDDFKEGLLTLVILLLASIFRGSQEMVSKLLVALNNPRGTFIASTFAGIANITLNLLLIPIIGLEGAAIASVLSVVINVVVCNMYLRKTLTFSIETNRIKINIIVSIILSFSSYLCIKNNLIVFNEIITFVMFTVIWAILMYILKGFKLNLMIKGEKV